MKRMIRSSSVSYDDQIDLDISYDDSEEYFFTILYDEEDDKYMAQGDEETFSADSLSELFEMVNEWADQPGDPCEVVDNIDYSMEGVKDEMADYGSISVIFYFTY